jgi:Arc/MetJ-type ribon-helix-helix transcriptional regulator
MASRLKEVHLKLGEKLYEELAEFMEANAFDNVSEAIRHCIRTAIRLERGRLSRHPAEDDDANPGKPSRGPCQVWTVPPQSDA